jgi:hypothetical protein
MSPDPGGFELFGVVHLVRPTGVRARTLEELRKGIAEAPARALLFHLRHGQLRDLAAETAVPDDFSAWVQRAVDDRGDAERLSFAAQGHAGSAEEVREAMLEALAKVPDSVRTRPVTPSEAAFVFLALESVPLSTGRVARTVSDVVEGLVDEDPSVCFYHLIEQVWFPEDHPTLIDWLTEQGADRLATWLKDEASSGLPIDMIRRRLIRRWRRSRVARRVGAECLAPEEARREAGRTVVSSLVRRITQTNREP